MTFDHQTIFYFIGTLKPSIVSKPMTQSDSYKPWYVSQIHNMFQCVIVFHSIDTLAVLHNILLYLVLPIFLVFLWVALVQ